MRNRAQTTKQQQAREQAKDQPFPSTKQKVSGEKIEHPIRSRDFFKLKY